MDIARIPLLLLIVGVALLIFGITAIIDNGRTFGTHLIARDKARRYARLCVQFGLAFTFVSAVGFLVDWLI